VSYLLDTNVVSETRKRRPDAHVERWLADSDPDSHHLSVLTLGEIEKGIAIRARRDVQGSAGLQAWLEGLRLLFAERILGIDDSIARRWGRLAGNTDLPAIDGLIAASALVHDLTVVTRNTKDFAPSGVRLIDPWRR
jgi:predicted nucleic acid-binding protein